MTGYVRQDVNNNIQNGQVANADDVNAEFNAVQAAFNASTGHTHDGSSAQGAPIEVIGPAQDFVATSTSFQPKTSGTYDLGGSALRWRDGWFNRDILAQRNLTVGGTAEIEDAEFNFARAADLNVDILRLNNAQVTATAANLNILASTSVTPAEFNRLSGVTSNIQSQINSKQSTFTGAATTIASSDLTANRAVISNGSGKIAVSGVTATELSRLSGIAVSTTEINHLAGVTSGIQSQLNALSSAGTTLQNTKQDNLTGAATTIASNNLTANRAVISNGSGKVAVSAVTATELGHLSGVTSAIQTQLNSKAPNTTHSGTVWNTGTNTAEALITPAKLKAAVLATITADFIRDASIPVTGWQPFDGESGLIYEAGVSTPVNQLLTPDLEDGWEYKLLLRDVASSAGQNTTLRISVRDDDDTQRADISATPLRFNTAGNNMPNLTIPAVPTGNNTGFDAELTVFCPRIAKPWVDYDYIRPWSVSAGSPDDTTFVIPPLIQARGTPPRFKVKNFGFSLSDGRTFAGTTKAYLLRRPCDSEGALA